MKNIIATASQRGSVNALKKPIEILLSRGHNVMVYATGNEAEAAGFGGLPYTRLVLNTQEEYQRILRGNHLLLTGLSGANTSDCYFIKVANELGIPSVAVNDQNLGYKARFDGIKSLPTTLAIMTEDCKDTLKKDLDSELSEPLIKSSRVVGWTAFDDYALIKSEFTSEKRTSLLDRLGLDPSSQIFFHATQNVYIESKPEFLHYETGVTEAVFRRANDFGLRLVVKPHPKEEKSQFSRDVTRILANMYNHVYIDPSSCDTKEIMLASRSVTAGRSTCLTEACLFGINTGGILPDVTPEELNAFPSVSNNAIPYTLTWKGIPDVLEIVTSQSDSLSEARKKFSVDGKASERLANLIEELI